MYVRENDERPLGVGNDTDYDSDFDCDEENTQAVQTQAAPESAQPAWFSW